jgi:protocatechuate 3,4-dioxygenase, alpha subunit
MRFPATPSQTVGPFFSIGFEPLIKSNLAEPNVAGELVTIAGRVLDGEGAPVPDAVLELWQADALGKYAHPEDTGEKAVEGGFVGFARVATDESGKFRFTTIKPGSVPGPTGRMQAPHLAVSIFMRGLLKQLVTRIYFPDESANAQDFVLGLVEQDRRGTLIAKRTAGSNGMLEWNVVLQGDGETVFFDV